MTNRQLKKALIRLKKRIGEGISKEEIITTCDQIISWLPIKTPHNCSVCNAHITGTAYHYSDKCYCKTCFNEMNEGKPYARMV